MEALKLTARAAILCAACAPAIAAPMFDTQSLPEPPRIIPYEIPSFTGKQVEFKAPVPAMKPAARIDSNAIFHVIANCYPAKPSFGLELELQAGLRMAPDNTVTTFDTSGLAKYYVGLVASLPLYSAGEIDKERSKEYKRRMQTAASIGELAKSISAKRRAQRQLGLYTSLEARSQRRVVMGVVGAEEQIKYMDKVMSAQASLDDAAAMIESARLALIGQCRQETFDQVNVYLNEVIGYE